MSLIAVLLVATLAITVPGVPPASGQLVPLGLLDTVTNLLNSLPINDLVKLVTGLVNSGMVPRLLTPVTGIASKLINDNVALVTDALNNPALNANQLTCIAKIIPDLLGQVNGLVPKLFTTVTSLPSNTLKAVLAGGSLNELPTALVTTLTTDLLANTQSSLTKCIG